jgi:hypothetical protein
MPEEVSNPFGLSDRSQHDPAMLAASYEAAALKDKAVVDVNGQHLGRVVRAFAEEGALTRFDVYLSGQAKRLLALDAGPGEVAGIPAAAIARIEGEEVRLNQAAEQLVAGAERESEKTGARDLPRKVR